MNSRRKFDLHIYIYFFFCKNVLTTRVSLEPPLQAEKSVIYILRDQCSCPFLSISPLFLFGFMSHLLSPPQSPLLSPFLFPLTTYPFLYVLLCIANTTQQQE